MKYLDAYKKVNDALEWLIVGFSGLLILLIVALPFVSAVVRYATGEGYTWLAESPPQLVPWIVFPLLGVVLRHDGHIAVDVLPHYVQGRTLTLLRAAVLGACLAAAVAFAVFGVKTVLFFAQLGQMSTTEIEFPMWVLYTSYPLGFILAANFAFESLLREIAGKRRASHAPAAAS
ncbi:MAG TPA: TRAP transporter small permease [Burkholderiales bacterium]|nr:TRAP transporter small permease [Burkholderiales bacterium]